MKHLAQCACLAWVGRYTFCLTAKKPKNPDVSLQQPHTLLVGFYLTKRSLIYRFQTGCERCNELHVKSTFMEEFLLISFWWTVYDISTFYFQQLSTSLVSCKQFPNGCCVVICISAAHEAHNEGIRCSLIQAKAVCLYLVHSCTHLLWLMSNY